MGRPSSLLEPPVMNDFPITIAARLVELEAALLAAQDRNADARGDHAA